MRNMNTQTKISIEDNTSVSNIQVSSRLVQQDDYNVKACSIQEIADCLQYIATKYKGINIGLSWIVSDKGRLTDIIVESVE
jgi:hypothetical protein